MYTPTNTTRGFTGHEHIDAANVVHMNGRLYDPARGRMLSADPLVQEMFNPQNLNRYTYVLNNPLSFTDPTGLAFISKYWRSIVSLAVTIFAPYLAPATWSNLAVAVAAGFVSGVVTSGSLQGGLYGAFSALLFYGIGSHFDNVSRVNIDGGVLGTGLKGSQFAAKVMTHGIAGGIMGKLQGGKFGHGFASAGATQLLGPAINKVDSKNEGFSSARVAVAAMVGGTVSAATGGKFANGALTAAFSRALNDELHGNEESQRDKDGYLIGGYSPVSGSYESVDGGVVDIHVGSFSSLLDSEGRSYGFDPATGMVMPLASGAAERVHPEAYIGVFGAWRLGVGAGYRAIAWVTARGAPTYETFAMGSAARTAWKAVNFSPRWLRPSRLFVHPRYYWARGRGNFDAAVRSLGQPNSVWDHVLIPTAPLATGLGSD